MHHLAILFHFFFVSVDSDSLCFVGLLLHLYRIVIEKCVCLSLSKSLFLNSITTQAYDDIHHWQCDILRNRHGHGEHWHWHLFEDFKFDIP